MSSETNPIETSPIGSSVTTTEHYNASESTSFNSASIDASNLSQDDSIEKQSRKKQNRQSWKSSPKVENKEGKGNKHASDDNGNDNDEKRKKEKKGIKNRMTSIDGSDQLKSTTSKNGGGKPKGSKDDSENKPDALESLQQTIAILKTLPVPSKSQKSDKREDEVFSDNTSKHKRHESNTLGVGKRSNVPAKQHKKGASVSFSFPLTTAVTASLKPIPDSEDGRPMDIENALQDTISSLRRMSLDNDAAQTTDKKQELDSPKSPFDFKKTSDEQQQSTPKKTHRRHQSLGYTLSAASSSTTVAKVNIPTHNRRHSVALNGTKDILKEIEKSQGRSVGADVKGHRRGNSRNFESNWRSTSLPPLLKSYQLVSGVLRINKRNRSDAYVTTESLDADIYICGSKDRNRALEGDVVAVELLDPEKVWQTKREKEEKKRKKEESSGIDKKKIDKKKDDVEVEGQGLLLFEDDDIVTDEQRPKYCGHVVAVMERMPGQLFSGTLALLRPSSTATKEREAAEKARREAEERAAGIEPKVEEIQDKKDERIERPKIVWFKPTDKRVPLIAIPTEQAPLDFVEYHQSYSQQLFVACIKRWPITSLHPFGTLVTQIGEIGNIDVETEALLKDNNVSSEEFNENVIKCLPVTPWTISDKEFETRRNLTSTTRIFTIDPPSANDIDDAVSCSRLPDGNYEIGVHIADVSYFVKPNTALDRDARKRVTSVYLVQKTVPMLPNILSEELCSLNPGVDRLSFSVIWKMTPEGKVMETWYGRTIIRSCAKLSYEHAQEVIEGRPLSSDVKIFNDYAAEEIEADIKVFHDLSQRLRENRFKRGALFLGSIRLNFELDEYSNPIECNLYDRKDSNYLIEEFMLLANMSVAQKISSAFPEQALLRRHALPLERRLNDFIEHARKLGYEINATSAGTLQKSLDAVEDEDAKQVLKLLAIKPMQRAKYFCTGTLDIAKYHHYALNVPLYTHFTSPIRRYADILVHRMLESALLGEKRFYLDKDTVQKTANHCNVKKDASKNAQEQSSHLFLCVLLNNLALRSGPVIREAIVIGVKDHAFDVLVPVFGIEKRVHLDQLPLEKFVFNEEKKELILHWKPGISSLEPIPEDFGFVEDEEDVLDVDEDALLGDVNEDYHYELMDVTSLPIEDEHRLFDANSDIGDDDIEDDDVPIIGDNSNDDNTHVANITSTSIHEFTEANLSISENNPSNQTKPTKISPPIINISEIPQLPVDADPSIPNSQIIRELCHLQVVITADCKKSPPVIKVLAVNPYM
ncbi:5385_t:CDS:10 [Diversispora eburnea]|uniref:DIS3-like exonuclease 2 n=1 Tax=Diversispora eburnea TaxID=1213867 RepID=A0A9N8YT23_9GLOM|nr:5385_t:CDS:10 [Diversispora eburnea]